MAAQSCVKLKNLASCACQQEQKIVALKNGAMQMQFADGGTLNTDMIVFSAGVRPDDALAKAADLNVGERGGIVIDYHCKTSDSDIFAIGECALWGGKLFVGRAWLSNGKSRG